jgi:hypothetical protein
LGTDIKNKISSISTDFSNNNGFAGTLDSFMLFTLQKPFSSDAGQDFWAIELPTDFFWIYSEKPDNEKFDYLVVDEIQDLLTAERLEAMDAMLKGGLKEGNWTFLGDLSNQAIYLDVSQEEALDRLTKRANYSKLKLKYNCRNPQAINNLNSNVTGCEKLMLREGMPEGQSKILFYRDIQALILEIEKIINELKNKNIPENKITLLSPYAFQLEDNSEVIKKALKNGMVKETIKSYKGLENTYILLMEFNEINTESILRELYVGISRSKFGLYLLLSTSLKKDFENLISKNLKP